MIWPAGVDWRSWSWRRHGICSEGVEGTPPLVTGPQSDNPFWEEEAYLLRPPTAVCPNALRLRETVFLYTPTLLFSQNDPIFIAYLFTGYINWIYKLTIGNENFWLNFYDKIIKIENFQSNKKKNLKIFEFLFFYKSKMPLSTFRD